MRSPGVNRGFLLWRSRQRRSRKQYSVTPGILQLRAVEVVTAR